MRKDNLITLELNNLLDGTFRFCLEDYFRLKIFSKLKSKYKRWDVVAKKLVISQRNLFGIRRGYEYRDGKKKIYFISSRWLINIQRALNLDIKEIEKHTKLIKLGTGGNRANVNLPKIIDLNKEQFDTVDRALAEYIYAKSKETEIKFNKPRFQQKDGYFYFILDITKERIESLRLQGLIPKIMYEEDYHIITYRNPGSNNRITRIVPKLVIFDEVFAKEFGKWIGDRCGGLNKIGISNKDFNFVKEFEGFLVSKLKQPAKDINIELTCKPGFIPPEDIKVGVTSIRQSNSQYGDYAYKVEVSNKILKNLLFDVIEENLYEVLLFSPQTIRFAFYAGFFEADGSVQIKSKTLAFAFGLNLRKENNFPLMLLDKVIKFKKLLEKDGFNPRISRKIANTDKSHTLKYDVILLNSHKTRLREISFIKTTFYKHLTYKSKKTKIIELEANIAKQKTIKTGNKHEESIQPEINIGLVGHY